MTLKFRQSHIDSCLLTTEYRANIVNLPKQTKSLYVSINNQSCGFRFKRDVGYCLVGEHTIVEGNRFALDERAIVYDGECYDLKEQCEESQQTTESSVKAEHSAEPLASCRYPEPDSCVVYSRDSSKTSEQFQSIACTTWNRGNEDSGIDKWNVLCERTCLFIHSNILSGRPFSDDVRSDSLFSHFSRRRVRLLSWLW